VRLRRYWDRTADSYDRRMGFTERRFFADTRRWLCEQAVGDTLEVAIGTGLNLVHYPPTVHLCGLEWSPHMLSVARRRALDVDRPIDLREGDARALPFADESFDTVVCTFALCAIPDQPTALREMARVLRPGGLLLLSDHVESSVRPVRWLQTIVDLVTVPLQGEHYRHRPVRRVTELGFIVQRQERFSLGIIERIAARKPMLA
jgi:ubiquinone/menaquinone biosynthesis C-methylase UbiE